MTLHVPRRIAGLLLGIALSGCATSTEPLTRTFSISNDLVKYRQTLNPQASARLDAVEGFDGKAASLAIDRYHKSFERAPVQPRFVLRVSDFQQQQQQQ